MDRHGRSTRLILMMAKNISCSRMFENILDYKLDWLGISRVLKEKKCPQI